MFIMIIHASTPSQQLDHITVIDWTSRAIYIFFMCWKTLFLGTRLVSVTKCRFECTSCNHRKIM
ncbi:Protein CBG27753 [Caenorhabditis briggsae]|uniref:Protein CBG27753 n=1 Tax=Caenorhabditis briggsae TaxID=6238 RepID=B6IJ51_CAEBR|nr:Protein CBG27753 [Caenorhabditis briggsae]CAS00031.1 Protein CBG27753 [Caenorhabditis briggsae]